MLHWMMLGPNRAHGGPLDEDVSKWFRRMIIYGMIVS